MNYNYIDEIFKKRKTPIWIMRQAGRYLPEYLQTRKNFPNFLEFCYNPEAASKVTLQPIARFDLDCAIIFSDILVIPDALGVKVDFIKNKGPVLKPISSAKNLSKIDFNNKIENIYEAINITRSKLSKEKPLIGFVGAPWTLATYLIEGGSSKDFVLTKNFAYNKKQEFLEIIEILTQNLILHIKNQIIAGANIIKIFDSWSGVLNEENFYDFSIKPIKKIFHEIKKEFPHIPIIGFPKGAGLFYKKYSNEIDLEILAIDSNIPRKWILNNCEHKITAIFLLIIPYCFN